MRQSRRIAIAFGMVTLACGSGDITSPVTKIPEVPNVVSTVTIAPLSSPNLYQGSSIALTLSAKNATGADMSTAAAGWSSSNATVASVSASGVVTGNSVGSATITAVLEGKSASVTVNVIPIPVASVSITVKSALAAGETTTATGLALDASGAALLGRTFVWSSSAPAIASVSTSGFVSALSPGTAVISLVADGVQGSATITVAPPPVASVAITLVPPAVFNIGATTTATATVRDAAGNVLSGRTVIWSTSNSELAVVTQSGVITALSPGTVTITAASEGRSASANLIVAAPPVIAVAQVVIAVPSTVAIGKTAQASAVAQDAGGVALARAISWSSSQPGVAAVNAGGLITGITAGTASITATSEGKTASGTISVTSPALTTIAVSTPLSSLQPGQTTQATAQLLDGGGNPATGSVTWTSSNPAAATVSSTGLVTAVAVGATTISATSGSVTGARVITVVPAVGSIRVTAASNALLRFETTQLSAIILDSFGNPVSGITPVWTSSNPALATVSSTGTVKAVGVGSLANVTFTATATGVSASAVITVAGHPAENLAELPRSYLDTSMPTAPATGGTIITVAAGGDLQAALNSAKLGDVIELAKGATFTGNFILPNKGSGDNWIVIRPSNYASLPVAGTRMTPSTAASLSLPKLVSPTVMPIIQTAAGAHHYRFTGVEVTLLTSAGFSYNLINLEGATTQTSADVPHDLVFDRTYVHGLPGMTVRRGFALNSASTAIVDSYISECHEKGNDSQAINGWNGPGPYKIVNNYLEGAGENVMFGGGGDPTIVNLVPSDIEIRHNHFYKPIAWKGVWTAKNLLEFKSAQRVLVEGNFMEGSWLDGQVGYAIVSKSTNQYGACTWCVTQNVTFRLNYIQNVGYGVDFDARPEMYPALPSNHITFTDNVIYGINIPPYDGGGRGVYIVGDMSDLTVAHNTILSPTLSAVDFTGAPTSRVVIRDNIIGGGQYSIPNGTAELNQYMPDGTFSANIIILTSSGPILPTGNFYPTTVPAVGFVSVPSNLSLSASSAYRNAGSDGKDPGANITSVMAAVQGAVVP